MALCQTEVSKRNSKAFRQVAASAIPRRTNFFYFDPENPDNVVEVKAAPAPASPARRKAQPAALTTEQVAKISTMQQKLAVQLESERQRVMTLQKYEGQYKEWRVRCDQLSKEVDTCQQQLYDKDNELSHAYRKLEASASERVALRKANLQLQEEREMIQNRLSLGEGAKMLQGNSDDVALSEPPSELPVAHYSPPDDAIKGSEADAKSATIAGVQFANLIKLWPH
eukprot:gene9984-7865_t